ncbi:MAG: SWIM zinc finger family protein [Gemmatimonadaceae bacterium]
MTARAKGGGDPRAAEYVDSPSMRMRIRDGQRLVVRIDGRYGFYRTELNLAAPNASSCSCPSDESPCKHVRALRKTWRVNPRSFLELESLLDVLSRRGRGAFLEALRTIILAHPECLGALGIPGFRLDDTEGDDDETARGATDVRGRAPERPRFTALQGQYLAFIHQYTQLHRKAPAESDCERHFKVSPPSVHRMIVALEKRRLIRRDPGQTRSVRVLLEADEIPDLDG